ncbi:MAG: TraR/DksA family transcriptional regulator [Bacteriovoracia bacterium]
MLETPRKKSKKFLLAKELKLLKAKIEEERERLIFKAMKENDDFNLKDEDRSDEVDQANADNLNQQNLRFRNREVFYDKKLRKALERMENKEYGLCEECGNPIGFTRLYARPTAEKCITCKEESERDESRNIFQRQSKSYGKAIGYIKFL